MINWFDHMYPYGNLHELNLDWVIATVKRSEKDIANFIGVNTIKYADPILWNIESQYEANTVVVDGQTGNAYISVKPVPSGVHINRTEYWTQIYNYANVVDTLRDQIAHNEGETTTATQIFTIGDLVFVSGILYRVIAPMIAGDSFVENSNIVKTTIEAEIARLHGFITNEASARESADTQLQTNIDNEADARESADNQLQSNIDNEAGARENADNQLQSNIDNEADARETADNSLHGVIGQLSNLDTEIKDNIVNAINELNNDIENFESDLMHYVYVENYLVDGVTATQALKQAIADCPSKGTVIIPRTQALAITETIVIDKPITIRGLSGGVNQLEGGNDNTPNSEYVKYDIRFTAGEIGFNILSPSVHIEDLVIKFNVNNDFIVFNLNSQTGDNLNMPRDIKLTNISCYNEDMSYSHLTYGVYSSQTCLLSTFNNVLFGWVSRGFYFIQGNINTSLRFINCSVTCKFTGFYLNHATYCYFIGCSVESANTAGAFYFDYCNCITMVGCFTEQVASASIISNTTFGLTIIGMFTTTLPILQATLGTATLIGCKSTIDGTLASPEVLSNGCNLTLAGNAFQYIKQGDITGHNVYNNHVLNHHEGISTAGYTISGATIVASSDFFNQIDRKCQLGCDLNVTSTTVTITCPIPLAPMYTSVIAGDGYKGTVNQNGTITLTFTTTGVHSIDIEYESIASF